MSFCSLMKGLTPKIHMLCFVLIALFWTFYVFRSVLSSTHHTRVRGPIQDSIWWISVSQNSLIACRQRPKLCQQDYFGFTGKGKFKPPLPAQHFVVVVVFVFIHNIAWFSQKIQNECALGCKQPIPEKLTEDYSLPQEQTVELHGRVGGSTDITS